MQVPDDVMETLNEISVSLYELAAVIKDRQTAAQGIFDVADEIGSLMVRMNRRDELSQERNEELSKEAIGRLRRVVRVVQSLA